MKTDCFACDCKKRDNNAVWMPGACESKAQYNWMRGDWHKDCSEWQKSVLKHGFCGNGLKHGSSYTTRRRILSARLGNQETGTCLRRRLKWIPRAWENLTISFSGPTWTELGDQAAGQEQMRLRKIVSTQRSPVPPPPLPTRLTHPSVALLEISFSRWKQGEEEFLGRLSEDKKKRKINYSSDIVVRNTSKSWNRNWYLLYKYDH